MMDNAREGRQSIVGTCTYPPLGKRVGQFSHFLVCFSSDLEK